MLLVGEACDLTLARDPSKRKMLESMEGIAEATLGKVGKWVVSWTMNVTTVGIGILFLIMIGQEFAKCYLAFSGADRSAFTKEQTQAEVDRLANYVRLICLVFLAPLHMLKDMSHLAKC